MLAELTNAKQENKKKMKTHEKRKGKAHGSIYQGGPYATRHYEGGPLSGSQKRNWRAKEKKMGKNITQFVGGHIFARKIVRPEGEQPEA